MKLSTAKSVMAGLLVIASFVSVASAGTGEIGSAGISTAQINLTDSTGPRQGLINFEAPEIKAHFSRTFGKNAMKITPLTNMELRTGVYSSTFRIYSKVENVKTIAAAICAQAREYLLDVTYLPTENKNAAIPYFDQNLNVTALPLQQYEPMNLVFIEDIYCTNHIGNRIPGKGSKASIQVK